MATVVESCVCGNELLRREGRVELTITSRPCRCEHPGPGSRQGYYEPRLPHWVKKSQYEERTALGLPPVAPIERSRKVF